MRRRAVNLIMTALCALGLVIALVPLASVLWLVVSKGIRGLDLDFFTQLPTPVGELGGGVGNAILGSLYIVGIAAAIGVPLGVGAGVYLAERGGGRLGEAIRFTAEVLSGVPSIIVGIVAYGLVVLPMRRFSAFAGGVGLAVLMVPTLARSTEELVRLVPRALREAALALGATRWEAIRIAVLPYARAGIMGATILGLGRALGETMAVTMLIGNSPTISASLFSPGYSLPAVIANEFAEASGSLHTGALAALGLILFAVTLLLNIAARLLVRVSRRGPARVAA